MAVCQAAGHEMAVCQAAGHETAVCLAMGRGPRDYGQVLSELGHSRVSRGPRPRVSRCEVVSNLQTTNMQ